uniref:Putative secreted protein n=1 Tax=Anopheles darlingi TaxID=43151 RepID=A0A2M4DR95_ANODA
MRSATLAVVPVSWWPTFRRCTTASAIRWSESALYAGWRTRLRNRRISSCAPKAVRCIWPCSMKWPVCMHRCTIRFSGC